MELFYLVSKTIINNVMLGICAFLLLCMFSRHIPPFSQQLFPVSASNLVCKLFPTSFEFLSFSCIVHYKLYIILSCPNVSNPFFISINIFFMTPFFLCTLKQSHDGNVLSH